MGTNSIIGYSLSGVGLAVIAFSTKIAGLLKFLGTKAPIYTILAGVVLVVGGVGFIMTESGFSRSGKVKHAQEEVPIYQGTGRNRKIVGYQKAE